MSSTNIDYNSVQYIRTCSVLISATIPFAGAGNPLELSGMHVKFQIQKADVGTPQAAVIRIYNLSQETEKQIKNEYTNVQLQAGYPGNVGLIFQGDIRQVKLGRENATDTYLDIIASDGDKAHNFAVVNTTIQSKGTGVTQQQQLTAIVGAMSPMGVTQGYTPTFNGPPLPRAKVCYGMAKDYLHNLADASGCSWHIDNGQVNMKPIGAPLPGNIIVVNAGTGMINAPRQTLNGIELRCLINPQIKFGGQIQIDNSLVQQLQLDVSFGANPAGNNFFIDPNTGQNTGLDNDGYYLVYAINFTGDTRGQEWYMDIICEALNATGPVSSTYQQATVSSLGF